MVCKQRKFTLTISIVCLDENEGIHLHVHVGFLFVLKWDFLHFLFLDYQGEQEEGYNRIKERQI
jgi:hypothetical protein